MTARLLPPNRRPSVNRSVTWTTEASEHQFDITTGFDPRTGEPIEVFYADGQRTGAHLQHAIQDACVLISLLLQHDVAPEAIAKSLSTAPVFGTTRPATVVGVIAEAVAENGGRG